jgi:predicted AlkP superfamily phosphohydrolase/phosphomutase
MHRRTFLLSAAATAVLGGSAYWIGSRRAAPRTVGKKVIVIGVDGMDPRLCQAMLDAGQLPNLARLRASGGFSALGTSIPPQSPVAWANFINGAGPGSHGIFDFIHRDPHHQCRAVNSVAEVVPGVGPQLRRQGEPFWEFLDAAGVPTTFYHLPSNYPPSPSQHGHHRCISGMGTPDMLGTYGVFQHFSEECPPEGIDHGSGRQSRLTFDNETAHATLVGPDNPFLDPSQPATIEFLVHRDRAAGAVAIDILGQRILLRQGQWSPWTKIDFDIRQLSFVPNRVPGIIRFYLQSVGPPLRLYVTPLNMDPAQPAQRISEPESFIKSVSGRLGSFYTTGFQEEYNARKQDLFDDDEYHHQANNIVLEERLALFDYALNDFEDGLLFFYFSSSDLQSHMFWWEWDRGGPTGHPSREDGAVWRNFDRIRTLYQRLDRAVGEVMDRFGTSASIFLMSDHGFANFGRQFNLNSWLRDYGYLAQCSSIMHDVDWSISKAYGLGINGLYVNLKGRERDGIVEPADKAALMAELKERLEAEVDPATGQRVIRTVYRADEVYSGSATAMAPDLIVGYNRGYRASWDTCLGDVEAETLSDNKLAWSADHCADALEVPGVLFSSRPFRAEHPALVDLAPSILAEFGLTPPASITGRSIFD